MSRRYWQFLGVAMLVVGVAVLGAVSHDERAAPSITASSDKVAAPAPRPAHRERASVPVRVEIPSIGVRAPVIKLGLNPDRSLEVPKDFGDTGWWSGGPRPGEPGPAVIVGHVDSYTGPAVFYRLSELGRGDEIVVVGRDGSRSRFTVEGSERYPKDDFPTARVYGRTDGPTLRLITCGGDFDSSTGHYVDNAVVYAH
jgi:sortase (surface protein transpeptidase)